MVKKFLINISPKIFYRLKKQVQKSRFFLQIGLWVWMGGWLPLPTRLQLYCDLASLVSCGHATLRHCPSVRPSVCWSMVMELKSAKTHFDAAVLIIFVCECVWAGRRCGWGLNAPADPSATILWPCVICFFLVADTQFYKRLCPSVGPSVCGDWVERCKMHICDWLNVCGVGVGVDGGFMPLPTRLQRYCNHASVTRRHL